MPTPHDRSVYPCDGAGSTDHVTDGSPCWCNPRVAILCTQCDGPATPDSSCWLCGGEGMIDAPDDLEAGVPTITIHDDLTGLVHAAVDAEDSDP